MVAEEKPPAVVEGDPSAVVNGEPFAAAEEKPSAVAKEEPSAVVEEKRSAVVEGASSAAGLSGFSRISCVGNRSYRKDILTSQLSFIWRFLVGLFSVSPTP